MMLSTVLIENILLPFLVDHVEIQNDRMTMTISL